MSPPSRFIESSPIPQSHRLIIKKNKDTVGGSVKFIGDKEPIPNDWKPARLYKEGDEVMSPGGRLLGHHSHAPDAIANDNELAPYIPK